MRLRHRQQVLHSVRLTLGIVGTMRVLLRPRLLVVVVVEGLWCTTRRAWVLRLRQQEARPVMLVRRLAGKRCEVVPARWTQPRRQVWLLVRRW